jgi:hypothetical protein
MAVPSIVWRNPNYIPRRRAWDRARRNASRSLYLVAESGPAEQGEWRGLPALEIIYGRAAYEEASAGKQQLRSGTTLSALWSSL